MVAAVIYKSSEAGLWILTSSNLRMCVSCAGGDPEGAAAGDLRCLFIRNVMEITFAIILD